MTTILQRLQRYPVPVHCSTVVLMVLTLSTFAAPGILAQTAQPQPAASAAPDTLAPHDPGFTKIMLVARVDKDSVVLRWAPGTPHGWRVANRTGYIVERRAGNGEFVRLTPDTLHPWLAFRFIDSMRAHPGHKYLGLVLNALWADSVLLEPDGADTVGDNAVRNTNLFGYALFAADNDPSIADAMGLRFVDHTVKTGDRYTYRIRLNEPREYRIDPGEVDVEVRPATVNPPPVNLTARGLERRIELRWEPQPTGEYTGYIVSRSADGGKKFTQMNTTPIVILAAGDPALRPQGGFTDSTVINYRTYVYRVNGITAFGERSTPAEVRAFARDLTPPPAPLLKNPKQTGRTIVQLAWDMPTGSSDLTGFIVLRSAFSDSNYRELTKKILPKSARQYTDNKADEGEPYYIVASLDTAGNRAASFPAFGALIDTLPPAVPSGLHGTIDTTGIVHLTWNRNRERSLLGYRVLRANAPEHEFTQLTGQVWTDTTFADTVAVHTLTRYVYYRVAAVNARYNHSLPSTILALRRYDATPPEAPAFYDVQASDSAIALRWAPSGSTGVRAHVLSRRALPSEQWGILATLPNNAAHYQDRAVHQGVMYEYSVEAVDSAGLHSPPGPAVQARPFDSGVRAAPTDLQAVFDRTANAITVTWTYTSPKNENAYIVIYRSRNGSPLLRYRSVEADQHTYIDREITGPGEYRYAAKVITGTGAESMLSTPARVTIEPAGK
jgi:fibronectin type 3 domain-containing protein